MMRFNDGGYSETQYCPRKLREAAQLVAKLLPCIMRETGAQAVAVTGKSGLSLAFATLMLIDFPLIVVRKRGENSHGSNIEGTCGVDVDKYLILDDFVSSGSTVRTIVQELELYNESIAPYDEPTHEIRCVGVVEYKKFGGSTRSVGVLGASGYEAPRFRLPQLNEDEIIRKVRESLAAPPRRRESDIGGFKAGELMSYTGRIYSSTPPGPCVKDLDFSKIEERTLASMVPPQTVSEA